MTVSVHNPDQYMASLRQIIAQGRKRIGLLVGAGAPAGIFPPGSDKPLIPAVAGLTDMVIEALKAEYGKTLDAVRVELETPNIETILSRVRSLAGVIGKTKVHDLDGEGYKKLSEAVCEQIGTIVNKPLHDGPSPYTEFVTWISGTGREHPVEIFTTNYDLLFEQALERTRVPFFDGFSGASEPFFDPSSVASNDLPARWTRLWKLHGSLGWAANAQGEVMRTGQANATHLVFPEHLKYDQTQKAPYAALFDRLAARHSSIRAEMCTSAKEKPVAISSVSGVIRKGHIHTCVAPSATPLPEGEGQSRLRFDANQEPGGSRGLTYAAVGFCSAKAPRQWDAVGVRQLQGILAVFAPGP